MGILVFENGSASRQPSSLRLSNRKFISNIAGRSFWLLNNYYWVPAPLVPKLISLQFSDPIVKLLL